jgi:glycine/D-amino acid oxidase-like deaminating enzyme
MAISFGVAAASLVTAAFIPDRHTSNPADFTHGLHLAFLVLGVTTIVSTVVFGQLKRGDGAAESQAGTERPAA